MTCHLVDLYLPERAETISVFVRRISAPGAFVIAGRSRLLQERACRDPVGERGALLPNLWGCGFAPSGECAAIPRAAQGLYPRKSPPNICLTSLSAGSFQFDQSSLN